MKLFGTDGIRGKAGIFPITAEVAEMLGKAIVTLADEGSKTPKIVVARDTRASGMELQSSLVRGIIDAGGEALLLGVLPSNAVSFAIQHEHAAGGVMISASHNPADENGLKFFNRDGFKLSGEQETKIESLLGSKKFRVVGAGPKQRDLDGYRAYTDFLATSLGKKNLAGLKIGIDAGNGAASFIIKGVFERLGAGVSIINNTPDGENVNAGCGALFPEQLQNLVAEKKLDAGVAFDGDADRLIMVDETGRVIEGDAIIAIIAMRLKGQGKLSEGTIVVTDYSNSGLDDSLGKQGINVIRVKTGDKYVSRELFSKNYSLGGENSGHIILPELSRTADAVLAAIQVLGSMDNGSKKLSGLSSVVHNYPQVLVNVEVREKKDIGKMPAVAAAISDGEKALGNKGRVFVRYSGTQDLLRIMVEGDGERIIKGIAGKIADAVRAEVGK